jgi:cytoskeletal protein CcmA (bactofilin family)
MFLLRKKDKSSDNKKVDTANLGAKIIAPPNENLSEKNGMIPIALSDQVINSQQLNHQELKIGSTTLLQNSVSIESAFVAIETGISVKGDLYFTECARISGIHSDGSLVGERIITDCDSVINSEIKCNDLTLYGKVNGSVIANKVRVCRGAEVSGVINSKVLNVEPGAIINAISNMSITDDVLKELDSQW